MLSPTLLTHSISQHPSVFLSLSKLRFSSSHLSYNFSRSFASLQQCYFLSILPHPPNTLFFFFLASYHPPQRCSTTSSNSGSNSSSIRTSIGIGIKKFFSLTEPVSPTSLTLPLFPVFINGHKSKRKKFFSSTNAMHCCVIFFFSKNTLSPLPSFLQTILALCLRFLLYNGAALLFFLFFLLLTRCLTSCFFIFCYSLYKRFPVKLLSQNCKDTDQILLPKFKKEEDSVFVIREQKTVKKLTNIEQTSENGMVIVNLPVL